MRERILIDGKMYKPHRKDKDQHANGLAEIYGQKILLIYKHKEGCLSLSVA